MNSRERVELALAHAEPDRVPIDYWAAEVISERLREHFGVSTHLMLIHGGSETIIAVPAHGRTFCPLQVLL